jgi:hypothetical protein
MTHDLVSSRARARRERSEYVHCLLIRFSLWLRDRLSLGPAPHRTVPCC